MADLSSLAIDVPEVLVPADHVDLRRWAVVACDQYTSQRAHWENLREQVGEAPSTLDLIFPEAYLGDGDEARRVAGIHARMRGYLERDLLRSPGRGFVYVERTTHRGATRRGLMVALDLSHYDYRPGARTLARATEETLEQRLPARLRVREGAALELSHVLVLIDDPDHGVIDPLESEVAGQAPLYDTPLLEGAGHLRGWLVSRGPQIERIARALGELADPRAPERRDGDSDAAGLLYAVGDGNHSLAAARLAWDRLRERLSPAEAARHPARHALVELVNLHDPGLVFEPIHRVVFEIEPDDLLTTLPGWFAERGIRCRRTELGGAAELSERMRELAGGPSAPHRIGYAAGSTAGLIEIEPGADTLAVEALQEFLDAQVGKYPEASIDYIHGDDVVRSLAAGPRRVGFYLPALDKRSLFAAVNSGGVLPRKSFSLGEASEKRFYMEVRRIEP